MTHKSTVGSDLETTLQYNFKYTLINEAPGVSNTTIRAELTSHRMRAPIPGRSYSFYNNFSVMINVPWQPEAICLLLDHVQCSFTVSSRNPSK